MNPSLTDPQTTPATELPPSWREVETSDWFREAESDERRRILAHWEGEIKSAAVAMPDYKPEDEKWIGQAVRVARQRVNTLERAGGKVKQSGKLLLRGAGAEGLYAGIEGAARGAANLATDVATGAPGTELAGVDVNLDRLRARRRELLGEPSEFFTSANAETLPVSPVDDRVIDEMDRDIAALEARKKDAADRLAKPVKEYAGAVAQTRRDIREALPVDPEFAASLPGQIAQGMGQAVGMLPTFAVPGVGPNMTMGLLYQQGFDDAKEHGADDETAHRAGVANVPAASLEYAADKLIIGKVLKPLRGKVTIRQLAKDVLTAGGVEGGTEGAQQAWQNYVAKELAQYDPNRPLDDQVLNSILVGAVVGGAVTGSGSLVAEGAHRMKDDSEPASVGNLADDTGLNVPERTEDLAAQQAQLLRGDRTVQMFPAGTQELDLPAGMERIETPRGVFHFDPKSMTADEILNASKAGKENELLGLGQHDKAEIQKRADAGEPVAAVVERGPAGEELRAAVVTTSTVEETAATMEAGKSEGSRVGMESLPDTLGRREEAAGTPTGAEKPGGGEMIEDHEAMARDLAAAREKITRRPAEQFKAKVETPDASDAGIVDDLAQYARLADRAGEDFGGWAQRTEEAFGGKVSAYLPAAWDAINAGKPVMDLAPPDGPHEIEGAWTRALKYGRLFYEGAGDVLNRGGFRELAGAVNRHVDLAERNMATGWGFVKPALDRITGTGRLLRGEERQRVSDEFAGYYRAKENGRAEEAAGLLKAASPETREMIMAAERLFAWTGYQNQRLGVQAFEREAVAWRPAGNLGKEYWPRIFNEETAAVLRDPANDPARWEQMKQELLENGNIENLAEADQFLRESQPRERADDFFANLELARTGKLPESFYEYDPLKVLPRFVARWAERSAQIEAYGQKLGEAGRDAFDRALAQTRSDTARNYIEATREHAYRITRGDPATRKLLSNVTTATAGLMLGNPYSAARNLIGGLAQTVNQFGAVRSLQALRRVWGGIADAELAGAVKADVADLIFGGEGSEMVRSAVNVAMKAGGFGPAETFVRAHSYLTAKAFLRDAIAAARMEPLGAKALQNRAFIQRLGIDANLLLAENGKGEATDSFLRGAVREAQGGYKFNQVPLFMDSPLGRFVFQFGRWGSQAMRFHAHNTFGPAVLGETVRVNEGGKVVEKRVRTLLPMLRSPLVAMGAGALTLALREAVLGIERNDASWDEIWRAKDEDEQRAFSLALERMGNDVIFAGTFGAVTDYGALLKDAATRNRFKNPVEPPAVSILKAAGALAYKLAHQKQLTREDYEQFFSTVISAYRVGSRMAYNFADKIGANWERAKLERADRDRRFVRSAGYRFADEAGLDENPYRGDWLPTVTERTPVYSAVENALLLGDALKANRLAVEYLAGVEPAKFKKARTALVTSVRSRQPVKPGGSTGRELQDLFLGWARERLSEAEYRRIVDIQSRYLETAENAQLLPASTVARWRQMANKPKPTKRVQHPPLNMEAVLQGIGLADED